MLIIVYVWMAWEIATLPTERKDVTYRMPHRDSIGTASATTPAESAGSGSDNPPNGANGTDEATRIGWYVLAVGTVLAGVMTIVTLRTVAGRWVEAISDTVIVAPPPGAGTDAASAQQPRRPSFMVVETTASGRDTAAADVTAYTGTSGSGGAEDSNSNPRPTVNRVQQAPEAVACADASAPANTLVAGPVEIEVDACQQSFGHGERATPASAAVWASADGRRHTDRDREGEGETERLITPVPVPVSSRAAVD